ncbi:MAG TPA: penicillin-binding transpeptidase domain-containing protein [Gemmatimonadales bacterium]|nr:penicillin-binding transpeptidase domain-containing protein [Gemmatimonadales bacterium]
MSQRAALRPAPARRLGFSCLILVIVLAMAGCGISLPRPNPKPDGDTPDRVAAALAAGLSAKDLSPVPFVGATGAAVNDLFQPLVAGMGPLKPNVTVASVSRHGSTATARLSFAWAFPGVPEHWTYEAEANVAKDSGQWKTSWQPSIVQPQLDGTNRLSQRRLYPERGELLGEDGAPIVVDRTVFRIGIDKSKVSEEKAKASAVRLAGVVEIDPKAYAAKVAGAGKDAFVLAIVLRMDAPHLPRGSRIRAIPGAVSIRTSQMLAPARDFARPIIGTVGDATKEDVEQSGGAVVSGDQVGLSGLQKRYDAQMRGTPGVRVRLVAAKPSGSSASPTPTPSPAAEAEPVVLFEVKPVPGKPLTTTLNVGLQKLAEKTLATTRPASALVAIRPSTGAIVAAANGEGNRGQSLATVGRAAPGSTFKVVSALALLRAGLTPKSSVTCPLTVTVNGRKFSNYSDYPRNHLGTIPLRTALAQSCNTAFIGQRGKLDKSPLRDAAVSLGFGTDYDVGFPSFFGSVPSDPSATGSAAAMIGQGKVEASPMVMAAVVASVAEGETVVPHLIDGAQATPNGKPLTHREARQLREMMRAVVTEGSGRVLSTLDGPTVLAKTGTAEYGASKPLKTHAWMLAAQGDLAVAVFVNDGKSGSSTAGPLLRTFLAKAR